MSRAAAPSTSPTLFHTLSRRLRGALFATLLTGILTAPILGLRLKLQGIRLTVQGQWGYVLGAMGAVFVVHLALAFWRGRRPIPGSQHRRSHTADTTGADPTSPSVATIPPAGSRPEKPQRWLDRQQSAYATRPWLALLWIVPALIFPFLVPQQVLSLATLTLIYMMLGLGLNIVVGHAGLLDLGYVAFYAVGAYSYALLNHFYGWGFWSVLPCAVLLAALAGFLLGFPVLRLRGDYLAIVTLGFGEIIRLLMRNLDFTGGPDGIANIPKPTVLGLSFNPDCPNPEPIQAADVAFNPACALPSDADPHPISSPFSRLLDLPYQGIQIEIMLYLLAFLLFLAVLWFTGRLIRLPIGRAWEALREDETACRTLGLNPTGIKLSAFTLGASIAGLAGCFFGARQSLITPESFTFIESVLMLSIVVLGGLGSRLGVVLAAILLTVLPELARQFAEFRMPIFGVVMVLMMLWRPQGLFPMLRQTVRLPEVPDHAAPAADSLPTSPRPPAQGLRT